MTLYATFLIVKGVLNLGAAIAAWLYLKDVRMAGFWLFLAGADLWIGLWSFKEF